MGGEDVCKRGLPDMTPDERAEGASKMMTVLPVATVVTSCIGAGIAEAVYRLGATEKYAAKIALVGGADLGWLYLGCYVVARTVGFVNM